MDNETTEENKEETKEEIDYKNVLCDHCKKPLNRLTFSDFTCKHLICYICLCRKLILDELAPISNSNQIIVKCYCNKGEKSFTHEKLNQYLHNKLYYHNMDLKHLSKSNEYQSTKNLNIEQANNNDNEKNNSQSDIVNIENKEDKNNNNNNNDNNTNVNLNENNSNNETKNATTKNNNTNKNDLFFSMSNINLSNFNVDSLKKTNYNNISVRNKSKEKCLKHKSNDVSYYCKTCNIEICQQCVELEFHNDAKNGKHILIPLKNYFRIRKFRDPSISDYEKFDEQIEKIKEEFINFSNDENKKKMDILSKIIEESKSLLTKYKEKYEKERKSILYLLDSLKLIYKVYYDDLLFDDSSLSRYNFLESIKKDFNDIKFENDKLEDLTNLLNNLKDYENKNQINFKFILSNFNYSLLNTLQGHTDAVMSLCQIDNGYLASGSNDHTIRLWDIITEKKTPGQNNNTFSFNIQENIANNNKTHNKKNKFRTIDKSIALLKQHNDSVFTLLNYSNDKLLSGGRDDNIIEWDVNSYSDDPNYISIKEEEKSKIITHYPPSYLNGKDNILSNNNANNIHKTQYKPLKITFSKSIYIYSIIKLSNGNFAIGGRDETIKIFDKDLNKIIKIFKGHQNTVFCVREYNPSILLSCSADKTVKLWDINKCKCLQTFKGHTDEVNSVVKLKNYETQFASASNDKTIKILFYDENASSNKDKKINCLETLNGHTDSVICLIQLKDSRLASSSCDKSIRIWDIKDKICCQVLLDHNNSVFCLIQVEDGRIISGSADNTIKIWG